MQKDYQGQFYFNETVAVFPLVIIHQWSDSVGVK